LDPDSQKSPRPRFRFGFSGKKKRANSADLAEDTGATTDDILDSLTRQAVIREKLVTQGKIDDEGIIGSEVFGQSWEPITAPLHPARVRKDRDFGRYGFALMLLGGLSVLWLYGLLTRTYELFPLNKLLQYSGVQTVFAQPLQTAVIAASALLAAYGIARRRKRSILRLQRS